MRLTVLHRERRPRLQSGGCTHATGMLFEEFLELNLIFAQNRFCYRYFLLIIP